MEKYYNDSLGKDFSSKVSELRGKLGTKTFDSENSIFGIAGNTFRAFTGYENPPSKIYREWAKHKTNQLIKNKKVPRLSNQIEFDNWHKELSDSISNYWNKCQNKSLSFAHTFKLVDLYIKWLSSLSECPQELAKPILKYAYCALDSQILLKLNKCLSEALPVRNPSMGDIINLNTYDYCQSLIKGFCEKYGGTRILFDYYAWEPGGASKK
jgi:hypothetical protein